MKKKRKEKKRRRTYKYQIREHPQNMRLGNMLDDLCDVHNHFLKLENRYYRIYGKYAGRYRLQPQRCLRQIVRLYRHIANQRKDWHFKLATDLGFRRFDFIATETLNLEGMKRLWGRKVSDLAFYQFVEILRYKCFKHNREFHQVGRWTPTTKPCSNCGHKNENLSLSDRQWRCPECGTHHDRDINAAINILRAACGPVVEQM